MATSGGLPPELQAECEAEIAAEIAAERAAAKEGGYSLPVQAEKAIAKRIQTRREAAHAKQLKQRVESAGMADTIASGAAALAAHRVSPGPAVPSKNKPRSTIVDPREISGAVPGARTPGASMAGPAVGAPEQVSGLTRQEAEMRRKFEQIALANAKAAKAHEARCGPAPRNETPPGHSDPQQQGNLPANAWTAGLKVAWSHLATNFGATQPKTRGNPSDSLAAKRPLFKAEGQPASAVGEGGTNSEKSSMWL